MARIRQTRDNHLAYLAYLAYAIIACCYLCSSTVVAETVILDKGTEMIPLGFHLEYVEDPGGVYTPGYLLNDEGKKLWKKSTMSIPNFGYTNSVYWLSVNLYNDVNADKSFLIEVAYPVIDHIDVFVYRESSEEAYAMGDKLSFSNRPVFHRNFVLPVEFAPKESVQVIMRFKTNSSMQLPVALYSKRKFIEKDQPKVMSLGVYYGTMLIMILYNFFIYFSVREANYLYYVLYVSFLASFMASLNGVCYQFLWPDSIWWNDQVIVVSLSGIVLFSLLFAKSFLELSTAKPRLNKLFVVFVCVESLVFLSSFWLPYKYAIQISIIATVVIFIGLLFTGILRWVEGFMSARYYTIAWCSLLVGGIVLALNKFNLLPRNVITENAAQIGSTIEVMLLSFALADRLNREKRERIEAQQIAHAQEKNARIANEKAFRNERKAREAREQALEIQKKATETLELRVDERTHELNQTLQKVESSNSLIMSSLRYASMIQLAMLPNPEKVREWFPQHYICWVPRDIVGGDFYYIDKIDDVYIIVVADCTGHGVPGAFMTMIASAELKRIVRGEKCLDPAEILSLLNTRVKQTLKQKSANALSDDGLDIGVCIINSDMQTLDFAGAKMPITYVHNNDIFTIAGDKKSIGYITSKADIVYTPHRINLEKDMVFYMYTDGLTDQPGEERARRFGTRRLREYILRNSHLPFNRQRTELMTTIKEFRGIRDPVDDLTMVAFMPLG